MADNRLHTPPHAINIKEHIPLVFLAGPVQGAPDWQTDFAGKILSGRESVHVASPRRRPINQLMFDAEEQVDWEHASLERARKFGVLAFWWAAQDLCDATYPSGRAYAQTTRIEIGKAIGWRRFQKELPVIVGYDPDYTTNGGGSEGYLRKELARAGISVCNGSKDFISSICESVDSISV